MAIRALRCCNTSGHPGAQPHRPSALAILESTLLGCACDAAGLLHIARCHLHVTGTPCGNEGGTRTGDTCPGDGRHVRRWGCGIGRGWCRANTMCMCSSFKVARSLWCGLMTHLMTHLMTPLKGLVVPHSWHTGTGSGDASGDAVKFAHCACSPPLPHTLAASHSLYPPATVLRMSWPGHLTPPSPQNPRLTRPYGVWRTT
jgi:hypothetical protein